MDRRVRVATALRHELVNFAKKTEARLAFIRTLIIRELTITSLIISRCPTYC
jgi:hypothetical protein